MTLGLLQLACVCNAPLLCWMLHARRDHHWPGLNRIVGMQYAALIAGLALLMWMLLLGRMSSNLALALTYPLAAVSAAGMVYVPCVRAWPRASVMTVMSLSLAALLCLAAAALAEP